MPKLALRNPFYFTNRNKLAQNIINQFNRSFFWGSLGGEAYNDDKNLERYIDYAYNINPDVYSVVQQIVQKFNSIPQVIKKIEDKEAYKRLNILNNTTKYNYSIPQEFKAVKLNNKAYSDEYFDMPLEKPNPSQSWNDFWALSNIMLQTTGWCLWYKLAPEEGQRAGQPIALYVLPSQLMEIVVKPNSDLLGLENPIDYYILNEGAQYTKFDADEVVCVKYANPNYDQNGSHLYGQSPLRAAYKNIVSTNKGLDLSLNTMKNGGAFGFLHAKDNQTPLTPEQAEQLKSRLKEMDKSSEDLGRIAGISSSIGFTRISLTTDELKPFDYFNYNLKMVCNALSWDDKLLNSDDGAKYDNMKVAEKRVVTGKTVPDIKLFSEAFNNEILPLFKGYEDKCLYFNVKELPEMQQDYNTMVDWITKAVDGGLIPRNEGRLSMGLEAIENEDMNTITVKDDVMTLEDAITPQPGLTLRE